MANMSARTEHPTTDLSVEQECSVGGVALRRSRDLKLLCAVVWVAWVAPLWVGSALAMTDWNQEQFRRAKWPEVHGGTQANPSRGANSFQVAPNLQCDWVFRGIGRFKNSVRDEGFDSSFDPQITISRRGLTARVVGTLTDEALEPFHGSLARLVKVYPWVIPVRQTAVHEARSEDPKVPSKLRTERGEIVKTAVLDLPPNSVMIIYPVGVGNRAEGFNTLAGNWRIVNKVRRKPNNTRGNFGQFPFLLFSGRTGHALHGPISEAEIDETWVLKRGQVSHGCARMEGEHVLELAVFLGCPPEPRAGSCPATPAGRGERVTVIEDFDHIPDPTRHVAPGPVVWTQSMEESWVAIDVDYPREVDVPSDLVRESSGRTFFLLDETFAGGNQRELLLPQRIFPTWDNRDLRKPLVHGERCH